MDSPSTNLIRSYGHAKQVSYKTKMQAREVECKLINEMTSAACLLVVAKTRNKEVIELTETIKALYDAQKKVLNQTNSVRFRRTWSFIKANLFYLQMKDFLVEKQASEELSKEVNKKGYEAENELRNKSL